MKGQGKRAILEKSHSFIRRHRWWATVHGLANSWTWPSACTCTQRHRVNMLILRPEMYVETDGIPSSWVFSIGLSKFWREGDLKNLPIFKPFPPYGKGIPGIPDLLTSDPTHVFMSRWLLANYLTAANYMKNCEKMRRFGLLLLLSVSFHPPVSTQVFSPLLPVCFCFLNFLYTVCPCNKDSMHLSPLHQNSFLGTFLVVQWVRLCVVNVGGLGLIPGQGSRSHRPQLRVCIMRKTGCSQIN